MRSVIALAVLSLTPLVAVGACSSTSTPSPEADAAVAVSDAADALSEVAEAADAAQCTLSRRFGSEVCESCLRARCCGPILACEADTACKATLDCVLACLLKPNATPCIQKCVQDNPAGKTKYDAFDACIAAPPDGPAPGCAFDCSQ